MTHIQRLKFADLWLRHTRITTGPAVHLLNENAMRLLASAVILALASAAVSAAETSKTACRDGDHGADRMSRVKSPSLPWFVAREPREPFGGHPLVPVPKPRGPIALKQAL
jgi:hypothetical protein